MVVATHSFRHVLLYSNCIYVYTYIHIYVYIYMYIYIYIYEGPFATFDDSVFRIQSFRKTPIYLNPGRNVDSVDSFENCGVWAGRGGVVMVYRV